MATFKCPQGDGTCTASDSTVALVNGRIQVGGEELVDDLFPEGMDFACAHPTVLELEELAIAGGGNASDLLQDDPKMLQGVAIEDIAPNQPQLVGASGILATCSPCGHRWVYESG